MNTEYGSTGTRTFEWLAYFYAAGGPITLFAAYELGFMAALPIVDDVMVVPRRSVACRGTLSSGLAHPPPDDQGQRRQERDQVMPLPLRS